MVDSNHPDFISQEQYLEIFPNHNPIYTYESLILAINHYDRFCPSFAELVCFLATIHHESGGLRFVHEINGKEQAKKFNYPGGEDFYGRGPIQLTGLPNYRAFGKAFNLDLENNPDLINENGELLFLTAVWYWQNKCRKFFTKSEYTEQEIHERLERVTTGGIRPGISHMDSRISRLQVIMGILKTT